MTKVNFTLNNEATDVQVALSEGLPVAADWTDCGATKTGDEVECNSRPLASKTQRVTSCRSPPSAKAK